MARHARARASDVAKYAALNGEWENPAGAIERHVPVGGTWTSCRV